MTEATKVILELIFKRLQSGRCIVVFAVRILITYTLLFCQEQRALFKSLSNHRYSFIEVVEGRRASVGKHLRVPTLPFFSRILRLDLSARESMSTAKDCLFFPLQKQDLIVRLLVPPDYQD